jgi:hypothetical protein
MGAGKSLYAVRKTVSHLLAGQYVVTNVELHPDAFARIAKRTLRLNVWHGHGEQAALVEKLRSRYVYETSLEDGMRYRLPGRGEARGLFIWDEGHNDLNNRDWRNDTRGELLTWATQLRKLGFVGYLLSQSVENTDAQLRRVCNFVVRLQNQREQTRLLGLRVSPWPLFLASWFPAHIVHGRSLHPMRTERYFLDWHRHLYDTHGLYHGLIAADEADPNVIALPAGGRVTEVASVIPSDPTPILQRTPAPDAGPTRTNKGGLDSDVRHTAA